MPPFQLRQPHARTAVDEPDGRATPGADLPPMAQRLPRCALPTRRRRAAATPARSAWARSPRASARRRSSLRPGCPAGSPCRSSTGTGLPATASARACERGAAAVTPADSAPSLASITGCASHCRYASRSCRVRSDSGPRRLATPQSHSRQRWRPFCASAPRAHGHTWRAYTAEPRRVAPAPTARRAARPVGPARAADDDILGSGGRTPAGGSHSGRAAVRCLRSRAPLAVTLTHRGADTLHPGVVLFAVRFRTLATSSL